MSIRPFFSEDEPIIEIAKRVCCSFCLAFGPAHGRVGWLESESDGTILEAKYGKNNDALWGIKLRHKGELFLRIDECLEETEDGYSDKVHFADGLKWAYVCKKDWEKLK